MKNLLIAAGLLAGVMGETAVPILAAQTTHKTSTNSTGTSSRRRRGRNVAIGAAGGAAGGAILGRGRGAGAGAVLGGTTGALMPTHRRSSGR
jgi:hypothetical protein